MTLLLTDGYLYPKPHFPQQVQRADRDAQVLIITGVADFKPQIHNTVRFTDNEAFQRALLLTGGHYMAPLTLTLCTCYDCYEYTAIIVGAVAYCGYRLTDIPSSAHHDRNPTGADYLHQLRANV